MLRIFAQQLDIVKDFKRSLENRNEQRQESAATGQLRSVLQRSGPEFETEPQASQYSIVPKSTIINAGELIDRIVERKGEMEDLEASVKRLIQQVSR
jgi:hypothetical protein